MDFAGTARLRGHMAKTHPTSPHEDLLRRLFYLLTTRFEDGAGIAVEGQAKNLKLDAQAALANRLHAIAGEAIILTDAVVALTAMSVEAADQGVGQAWTVVGMTDIQTDSIVKR